MGGIAQPTVVIVVTDQYTDAMYSRPTPTASDSAAPRFRHTPGPHSPAGPAPKNVAGHEVSAGAACVPTYPHRQAMKWTTTSTRRSMFVARSCTSLWIRCSSNQYENPDRRSTVLTLHSFAILSSRSTTANVRSEAAHAAAPGSAAPAAHAR